MNDTERHAYNRAIQDAQMIATNYGQDVPAARMYATRIAGFIGMLFRHSSGREFPVRGPERRMMCKIPEYERRTFDGYRFKDRRVSK